jgi:hypothetical protein
MKDVESVLKRLSDLYEFNRKLKSYALRKPDAVTDPQAEGPEAVEAGTASGKSGPATGQSLRPAPSS